ncbi:integrin-linked kinase-associated serine/threonine phosphatase 2C-like [Pecten maximus]|uniref:integrin-linked kinase-associated serine/threonine phosphatase 2C-like n=1 Tax=Pecten maximus TaxID=6579 RepID=UPI001458A2B0|nr:integrin-linked kinase-associated serine/threonine phosphatase 2C-like [Pecten maximus]XP_033763928.1 integrin-linked kinase-associated serine/threonine phosphatase 2C-like [Pecten maximus]XP_033763929.1 integrin-linked kinase-associated serine/threonine phosphatase 2C-like [Pecten maximus]
MDLFGDLPEPTAVTASNKLSTGSEGNVNQEEERGQKRKDTEDELIHNKTTSKIKASVQFRLKGYMAERRGEREEMQDAHVMMDDFTSEFTDLDPSIVRLALYAVFDGHGGARASRFASQHLHKILRDNFPKGDITQVDREIKKVFVETCKKTDEEFLKLATKSKPSWKDGTTVSIVLVVNDTVYTANLGDSQVFLCRQKEDKHIPIHLTTVHNPSAYEERIRIQKAGGSVKEGRVMGVLDVSRSIGDGQYKKHGVTCLPDMKKCQLTQNDRYLLIACDGLWKAFSPEECIKFTNTILEDSSLQGTDYQSASEVRLDSVVNKLANNAVLRLSSDNVTVMVVDIKNTNS